MRLECAFKGEVQVFHLSICEFQELSELIPRDSLYINQIFGIEATLLIANTSMTDTITN